MALVAPLFPRLYNTTDEVRHMAAIFIVEVAMFMPGQCIPACKLLYPALRWKNDHHVPVRQRLYLGCQCAGGFLPEPFYRTFDLRNLLYGYVG